MNNITTFNFLPTEGVEVSHAVRTVAIDGEPWFAAKDVAEVLGYVKPGLAIQQHCRGAVKRSLIDALGRWQETAIIPERDVYRLIMRSKLPSAERFEEWVVGTVLPTIRKTGSYVRGEEAFDVTTEAGLAAATMHVMAALQAKADGFKAMYEAAKPKADAFQVIAEAEGALTITDAAKALKAKPKNLFAFLEAKKLVTKGPNRQATVSAQKRGIMDVRTSTDPRGRIRTSPVVTPKGLAYLADAKANFEAKRAA